MKKDRDPSQLQVHHQKRLQSAMVIPIEHPRSDRFLRSLSYQGPRMWMELQPEIQRLDIIHFNRRLCKKNWQCWLVSRKLLLIIGIFHKQMIDGTYSWGSCNCCCRHCFWNCCSCSCLGLSFCFGLLVSHAVSPFPPRFLLNCRKVLGHCTPKHVDSLEVTWRGCNLFLRYLCGEPLWQGKLCFSQYPIMAILILKNDQNSMKIYIEWIRRQEGKKWNEPHKISFVQHILVDIHHIIITSIIN